MDTILPSCWDPNECPCQSIGDATCDGAVNLADLMALRRSFGKNCCESGYDACADFDQNCEINLGDLLILKQGWGTTGCTP